MHALLSLTMFLYTTLLCELPYKQNFGGRKFWRNCSHQKLTNIFWQMPKNYQSTYNNNYVLTFTIPMAS